MTAESPHPTRNRLGYLPALDGLRAMAITMVVGYHVLGTKDRIFEFGVLGIDVFFVLSGFLITALISEAIQSGRLSRRRFYARRAIRLVPALLVMLAVFAPLGMAVGTGTSTWLGAVAALLYLTPFMPTGTIFDHTWTLALEEWFYLLWPVVLARLFRDHLTLRQCAILAGSLGVASQAAMVVVPGSLAARPSALLLGCSLALWWLDGGRFSRPAGALAVGIVVILAGAIGGSVLWGPLPFWMAVSGSVLAVGAIASNAGGPVARVLRTRPVVAIGAVSYEWYLIHAPALKLAHTTWGAESYWVVVPLSLWAAFALHRVLLPLQVWLRRRLRADQLAPTMDRDSDQ